MPSFERVWLLKKATPGNKLCTGIKKQAGRNRGKISVRHKGGGKKARLRLVDFRRALWNVSGYILSLETEVTRSSPISLVYYPLVHLATFVLTPQGLLVGDKIISGETGVEPRIGNSLLLKNIPLQTFVHCIESTPYTGGKFVRTSGGYATVTKKIGTNQDIRVEITFLNGKKQVVSGNCIATIGQLLSNTRLTYGFKKAGTVRNLNKRPTVRGVAMNPVDHPHGGGNGKKSGKKISMSPWRKLGKGVPTV